MEVLKMNSNEEIQNAFEATLCGKSNILRGLPEYQNLLLNASNSTTTSSHTAIQCPSMTRNPFARGLPPLPLIQPRKCKDNNKAHCEPQLPAKVKRVYSSQSGISNVANCPPQSLSLMRSKQSPREVNNTLTSRRPHVLHKKCSMSSSELEKLSSNGTFDDIVIVYSKKCQVSEDWAKYMKSMFIAARCSALQIKSSNNGCNKDKEMEWVNEADKNSCQLLTVTLQEIEEFSTKACAMRSSINQQRYVLISLHV